jgi:hypothetical protein
MPPIGVYTVDIKSKIKIFKNGAPLYAPSMVQFYAN